MLCQYRVRQHCHPCVKWTFSRVASSLCLLSCPSCPYMCYANWACANCFSAIPPNHAMSSTDIQSTCLNSTCTLKMSTTKRLSWCRLPRLELTGSCTAFTQSGCDSGPAQQLVMHAYRTPDASWAYYCTFCRKSATGAIHNLHVQGLLYLVHS